MTLILVCEIQVGCSYYSARLGRLDLHRLLGWWSDDHGRHVGSSKKVRNNSIHFKKLENDSIQIV